MRSTQIQLARRPEGAPQDSDFEFVDVELPALADGEQSYNVQVDQ